jgi:hypothetical protein
MGGARHTKIMSKSPNSIRPSGPNKLWWRVAASPELGKLQPRHGGRGHFEDDLARMPHNLGSHVDNLAPQGGGVGFQGHHLSTDILLEALQEEKSYQHGVVKSRIGTKTQKGQLFKAEILEGAVHQFIGAPAMSHGNDIFGQTGLLPAYSDQTLVNGASHTQIGVVNGQWAGKGQQPLLAGYHRPTQDDPPEGIPATPSITVFQIIPGLLAILIPAPLKVRGPFCKVLDILINSATANDTESQSIKRLQELLVKKAGIHTDDDGNLRPIVFPDKLDGMADRLEGGIPMVAVLATTPKHRIDDEAPPGQLQGLKALHLLVSRFDAMALLGFIVIHDHSVQAQLNDLGFVQPQSSEKHLLQQRPEQPNAVPREGVEKPFDGVGRQHVLWRRLDGGGVSSILLQGIEVDQMPAGAVRQETKDLLEHFRHGLPLGIFADRSEKALQE